MPGGTCSSPAVSMRCSPSSRASNARPFPSSGQWCSTLCAGTRVPGGDLGMRLHRLMVAQQLRKVAEDLGGGVIDGALEQRAQEHEELEIRDLQRFAPQERLADLQLGSTRPVLEIPVGELLAGALAVLLLRESGGRKPHAKVLDRSHQGLVARGLPGIDGVQAVEAADQPQDGVGLRDGRMAFDGQYRKGAVGCRSPPLVEFAGLETLVVEGDARSKQRQAAFFAAARGIVEVGEGCLWHGSSNGGPGPGAEVPPLLTGGYSICTES